MIARYAARSHFSGSWERAPPHLQESIAPRSVPGLAALSDATRAAAFRRA